MKGCRDGQMERSLLLHHLPSSHPLNHMQRIGDDDMCGRLTEGRSPEGHPMKCGELTEERSDEGQELAPGSPH